MIRTTGLKSKFKPFEAVSMADNIYFVRWDCVEIERTDLAVWAEEIFHHKPTEAELRKLFTQYYNNITDNQILSGFIWNGMLVWLSEENQRNYQADYLQAITSSGRTLPVKYKFGTDEEPEFYTFKSLEDITDFYNGYVTHIREIQNKGWENKDNIDFSPYDV